MSHFGGYFPSFQVGAITIWRTFCRGDHRRDNDMAFVLAFPHDFGNKKRNHLPFRALTYPTWETENQLQKWLVRGYVNSLFCSWWSFFSFYHRKLPDLRIVSKCLEVFPNIDSQIQDKYLLAVKHGFTNGWPSIGCWTKSFYGKWLDITKHPLPTITGWGIVLGCVALVSKLGQWWKLCKGWCFNTVVVPERALEPF